jgi:hypothetical protein
MTVGPLREWGRLAETRGLLSASMVSAHRGENLEHRELLPSPNPRAASFLIFLLIQSPRPRCLLSSPILTSSSSLQSERHPSNGGAGRGSWRQQGALPWRGGCTRQRLEAAVAEARRTRQLDARWWRRLVGRPDAVSFLLNPNFNTLLATRNFDTR